MLVNFIVDIEILYNRTHLFAVVDGDVLGQPVIGVCSHIVIDIGGKDAPVVGRIDEVGVGGSAAALQLCYIARHGSVIADAGKHQWPFLCLLIVILPLRILVVDKPAFFAEGRHNNTRLKIILHIRSLLIHPVLLRMAAVLQSDVGGIGR